LLIFLIALLHPLQTDLLIHHASHFLVLFIYALERFGVENLSRVNFGLKFGLAFFDPLSHDVSFFLLEPDNLVSSHQAFPLVLRFFMLELFKASTVDGRGHLLDVLNCVLIDKCLVKVGQHHFVASYLLVLLLKHSNCVKDIKRIVNTSPKILLLLAAGTLLAVDLRFFP